MRTKKPEIGTQDWLENAESVLSKLAKESAEAEWWEICAAISVAINCVRKLSRL